MLHPWFCPSVFLYLVSVVPPIWLMELGLKDLRVNSTQVNTAHSAIGGVKLDLALPIEQWVRVLEQVMLVMLLVGRWLLPKGKLTREQLSQLLLAYMAMAADVIELFECFKEDAVTRNVELIYATLAIWSWSLLQFTLVLSATYAPKQRPSINFPPPQEVTLLASDLVSDTHGKQVTQTTCSYIMYLDMDIVAILTTVFMQDGPFFLLRMTLIFGYKVVSYLNIFFTCKNTLIISLQLYRLFVLCSRKRIINEKRRELLGEKNPLSEECEETEEEKFVSKNLDLPPPPPQNASLDHTLEASLLEIIEQVGEENIVKELENLVSLNSEKESPVDATVYMKNLTEPASMQASRNVECQQNIDDHYFLPDSDFTKNFNPPVNTLKRTRKLHNSGPQECSERAEDFPSCCDVSDCPSYSDTEQTNDKFLFDHQGVSVSSTSLAEPFMAEIQRPQWPQPHDRFMQHYQQREKGASFPSSLHRDPGRKVSKSYSNPPFTHYASFSPGPQRRIRNRPDPRSGVGSTHSLCQGSVMASTWNIPHQRHSFVHSSKYTGISESDADTLETNV